MSGIGGLRVFRGGAVIEDDLHRIAASLRHRGTSATSAWTGPDIGLAHTRMEPIGPGTITQPLHSADGRWVVVVDGVGRPLGIVSSTDVLAALTIATLLAWHRCGGCAGCRHLPCA